VKRPAVVLGIVATVVLAPAVAAHAHPLGNFTVNRYSGIHVSPSEIRVDYVVDMAEIPTFQEMESIDADGDDVASESELSAWASARALELADGLALSVNGGRVPLEVQSARAQLLPGQGDLQTLRFEGDFRAPVGSEGALAFTDRNFADQIGWREITAVGQDGAALRGSTVPTDSVSDALRTYPQDLLASPLDITEMTASFEPGKSAPGSGSSLDAAAESAARPGVESGPFTGLLTNQGPVLVMFALLLAVAFGAWHALLPGHGKTLMAAYMVGSKARTRQAVSVGSAVAVMHTVSVLGLGLLVLTLERTFRPETLYPWLGLLSGLVALALGAYLLISRLSAWGAATGAVDHTHALEPDGDEHGRPGVAGSGLAHDHGLGRHSHAMPAGAPLSPKGLMALALAGGILPAPSALLVMLGAINAHRVGYGLALVLAFSAGLAAALIVIGMGALRVRDAMARRLSGTMGRLVPVLSAAAIVVVGGFLTICGLTQV
jgi:ABC-type nickel/cobalt efflux system permease component RcnA